MIDVLRHRGPDASGRWMDATGRICLAHTRLSILDTTSAGAQPMTSPSGRYVISFNGEIYNHLQLRLGLSSDYAWKGHSDTETLLHSFDRIGVQQTIDLASGMFAMAVWDADTQSLTLARDRLGEKPLYFSTHKDRVIFASELKSIKASKLVDRQIDPSVLAEFLEFGYVPGHRSIYQAVRKVPPGCMITMKISASGQIQMDEIRYWSLQNRIELRRQQRTHGSWDDQAYLDSLEAALRTAVKSQMLSDVPLGAFLSGGIDSSIVTALMQSQCSTPVKTFTIGFQETTYDESEHARKIAKYLGTEHTELVVTPSMAQEVIPKLPLVYDEPFADASQIPTLLLCQLARSKVTVALSGDGADEMFGGYSRHFLADPLWSNLTRIPYPLRAVLSSGTSQLSSSNLNRISTVLQKVLPEQSRFNEGFVKLQKLGRMAGAKNPEDLYGLSTRILADGRLLLKDQHVGRHWNSPSTPDFQTLAERFMYVDAIQYLPDDVLVKVDRAAMSCSLETRAPFLAPDVIDAAWQLPAHLRTSAGKGKLALRHVLNRYIPAELTDRPKQGFSVPIGQWLRGPLRGWAESLIAATSTNSQNLLDTHAIWQLWREHLSGKAEHQQLLWNIMMFQAWFQEYH